MLAFLEFAPLDGETSLIEVRDRPECAARSPLTEAAVTDLANLRIPSHFVSDRAASAAPLVPCNHRSLLVLWLPLTRDRSCTAIASDSRRASLAHRLATQPGVAARLGAQPIRNASVGPGGARAHEQMKAAEASDPRIAERCEQHLPSQVAARCGHPANGDTPPKSPRP